MSSNKLAIITDVQYVIRNHEHNLFVPIDYNTLPPVMMSSDLKMVESIIDEYRTLYPWNTYSINKLEMIDEQ